MGIGQPWHKTTKNDHCLPEKPKLHLPDFFCSVCWSNVELSWLNQHVCWPSLIFSEVHFLCVLPFCWSKNSLKNIENNNNFDGSHGETSSFHPYIFGTFNLFLNENYIKWPWISSFLDGSMVIKNIHGVHWVYPAWSMFTKSELEAMAQSK